MKKTMLYLVLPLVLLGVAVQFVPVARTNPSVTGEIQTPAHIQTILKKACWDCHSNQTRWPWYSYLAPVSWLISHDVKEGRSELNFSTWTSYHLRKKRKKLEEIDEEVQENKMPPRIYTWLHPQANLTAQEKTHIQQWVKTALSALPRSTPKTTPRSTPKTTPRSTP